MTLPGGYSISRVETPLFLSRKIFEESVSPIQTKSKPIISNFRMVWKRAEANVK